jgi:four helix bundle protein
VSRDHTKLRVFTLTDELVLDVYQITRQLPAEERFGLLAQIRRATVSAPSNIVEGAVRRSEQHYLGYLETALGSACEARYLLGLCVRLGLLPPTTCEPLIERFSKVVRRIAALVARIDGDLASEGRGRKPPTGRTPGVGQAAPTYLPRESRRPSAER